MLYSRLFVAASALAVGVSAQTNFTTCCNVDPTTVDAPTRASWCRAQQNTCPELCPNGQTTENSCDDNALTYNCTCLSGSAGNVSDYGQTLPSLECDEWTAQCTAAHPNDLAGQTFCQSFVCGSKNASAQASTGSSSGSSGSSGSSSASSSATGTAASSGSSTASASAAASSSGAAIALQLGKEYGTGAVAVGLLALFGMGL